MTLVSPSISIVLYNRNSLNCFLQTSENHKSPSVFFSPMSETQKSSTKIAMSRLHPPSTIFRHHTIFSLDVQPRVTPCSRLYHRGELRLRKCSNASYKSINLNVERTKKKKKKAAAFFDVDGTITRTNVVAAYFNGRVKEIPPFARFIWVPWFAMSCILYLIVDHIDRTAFNHLFYSVFKGQSTFDKKELGKNVYQNYYCPRIYGGALKMIRKLKQKGYHIVLVTGCLDFLIAPLAQELGADFMFASKLVEKDGKFTGEIKGAGANERAKADFVKKYAKKHEICLSSSLAFGDSIADLSMLNSVGNPRVVNPDNQLMDVAVSRQWPIVSWKLEKEPLPFALGWVTLISRSRAKLFRDRYGYVQSDC